MAESSISDLLRQRGLTHRQYRGHEHRIVHEATGLEVAITGSTGAVRLIDGSEVIDSRSVVYGMFRASLAQPVEA